jgi:hypothetical protein
MSQSTRIVIALLVLVVLVGAVLGIGALRRAGFFAYLAEKR